MSDDGFYHAFEAAFRGSREEIRIRLKAYRPYLEPLVGSAALPQTALDLGCGRGEWLELLGDLGFAAQGVDLDGAMLDDARALGLDVTQEDALAALRARPDGALGLVSAFHLIEHIPFEDLLTLVAEVHRVLAPGGLMILETPNSENIDVATVTFHNDPTHTAPMPPNVLRFLAEHTGFAEVCLRRLNESPHVAGGAITLEDVFTQVSPDYAVIAQRDGPSDLCAPLRPLMARQQGLTRQALANRFEERLAERAQVTNVEMALQRELHHVRHAHNTLLAEHQALAERHSALDRERQHLEQAHARLTDAHRALEDAHRAGAEDLAALKTAFSTHAARMEHALSEMRDLTLGERLTGRARTLVTPAPMPQAPLSQSLPGTLRSDEAGSDASPPIADTTPSPEPDPEPASEPVGTEQEGETAGQEGESAGQEGETVGQETVALPVAPSASDPAVDDRQSILPALSIRPAPDRDAFGTLPEKLAWRMEGPFDSSYSLAVVNRALARALTAEDVEVALVSAEGPGPFEPDAAFLAENPDLRHLWEREGGSAPLVSRNMYPPRVHDIGPGVTGLHNYAWEETGLPEAYVAAFNESLSFLTVTSEHVRKTMIDNGVAIPIHVTGNGVDHLEEVVPEPLPEAALPDARKTFLHVSSCFPRKGADALLAAWARAFGPEDNVTLVLKTFDNPHNDIAEQVRTLRADQPETAPITVVAEDWTPGQMRSLYRAADCVVLPSRAEGFGLPVAEALLEGTPVITTGWSGQRVFEGCPMVQFIDYELAPANSHIGADQSLWAEPDVDDLVQKLRAAALAPPPAGELQAQARDWLMSNMRWRDVARRSVAAVRQAAQTDLRWPKTGWISTFNSRCGIATYSAHLISHLGGPVEVLAPMGARTVVPDDSLDVPVHRCWTDDARDPLLRLFDVIEARDLRTIVLQFNYAFYDFESLARLIDRLTDAGRQVILMMHGTDDTRAPSERQIADMRASLARCTRLLVHSLDDVARLKALGLVDNVTFFPHGCLPVTEATVYTDQPPIQHRPTWLGTYGFMLANKGLPELIDALAILRGRGHDVRLKMLNALYPKEESRLLRERCARLILQHELAPFVQFDTAFRPDQDVLGVLASCDLVVFPYQHSAESASGALRYGLTADRPVVATPLGIFREFADVTLNLPGLTPTDMADGLDTHIQAMRRGATFEDVRQKARAHCAALSYERLGPRLYNMIVGLATNR